MGVLIGVLVLAFLALPVIALIVALSGRGERQAQQARLAQFAGELASLRDEVARLSAGQAGEFAPETPRAAAPGPVSETAPLPSRSEHPVSEHKVPDAEPVAMDEPQDRTPETTTEPVAARERSSADFESAIGARWSVIVGGIAVALGAVFLVRYTIEAGLLGPAARITLGALFSAFLFAAGEWLRRRDKAFSITAIPNADIPGILTGAGSAGAFATVYAAYALYGFVGPGPAFVLLTLVGLASLALSAVHGPKLAALGVVGAYATPLLVSTQAPNPLALAIHVLVVTAAIMGVARLRNWLWLAYCGVAGGAGWTMMEMTLGGNLIGIAGLLLLVGLAVIFVAGFAWQQADRPSPPEDRPADRPAIIAFGALAAVFFVQAAVNGQLPLVPAGLGTGLVVLTAAAFWPALAPAAIAATVIVLAAIAATDLQDLIQPGLTTLDQIRQGLVPPDIASFLRDTVILAIPAGAGAVWAAWRYGAGAKRAAGWLASAAGAIGFFTLVLDYLRISPFETRPVFGAAGLLLALIFAGVTESFIRLDREDNEAPAPAAFAVGAVASLCFAIAVSLDAGWMPLAFALASLGIAWVYIWRPVAVLPWLSVAAAIIGAGSLWASLPFDAASIGTTPLFNKLILLTGLPAAAMIVSGEILRRSGKDVQGGIVSALGLAISGLFVSLEIRHWLNGGDISSRRFDLSEAAAQALAAMAFTAGLQRIGALVGASIYRHAATAASAIGALLIAFGLLMRANPYLSGEHVGATPLFNMLLPGYLLTGLAAAAVAFMSRDIRPRWFTLGYAALAGLLLFTYITLSVRHAFQGNHLFRAWPTSDPELWTYSVVWLVTGAAVLLLGLWLNSLPIRAASGILIALTVCKVFLLDMSELSGVFRALSFIGLGLSLLAIGRLYQRLLARRGGAGDSTGTE
ncbi:MAG: DUF2339 domain-containing protein [Salaquimonas sp.]|nr:DUF2339 domain-containing protein [Salaquimonas sp.]